MNDSVRHRLDPLRQSLAGAWGRLAPRERLAAGLAGAVVGLALIWWLALAPALATLRQAPQQQQQLDAQVARVRAMAASAQALRGQGGAQPLAREASQRALVQATQERLGDSAQARTDGDQTTVTLNKVAPDALAHWLEQVRVNARLMPVQADLQFSREPAGWSGQLVLAGPAPGAGN